MSGTLVAWVWAEMISQPPSGQQIVIYIVVELVAINANSKDSDKLQGDNCIVLSSQIYLFNRPVGI